MKQYIKASSQQFLADMEEATYDVEHYHGRFFWEGPAVRVNNPTELADVIGSTAVKLQWDNLGLGYIVYPVEPDAGMELKEQTASA